MTPLWARIPYYAYLRTGTCCWERVPFSGPVYEQPMILFRHLFSNSDCTVKEYIFWSSIIAAKFVTAMKVGRKLRQTPSLRPLNQRYGQTAGCGFLDSLCVVYNSTAFFLTIVNNDWLSFDQLIVNESKIVHTVLVTRHRNNTNSPAFPLYRLSRLFLICGIRAIFTNVSKLYLIYNLSFIFLWAVSGLGWCIAPDRRLKVLFRSFK